MITIKSFENVFQIKPCDKVIYKDKIYTLKEINHSYTHVKLLLEDEDGNETEERVNLYGQVE